MGNSNQPGGTGGPDAQDRPEGSVQSPTLFLVRKHKIGGSPENLHRLSSERQTLLTEAVQEQGEIDPTNLKFQELLKNIYQKEYWIGCSCREGRPFKEAPVPLLTVQHRKNRYVLLRLPRRASHREGCPFEGDGAKSDPSRREGERIKARGVCFHRKIPQRTEERSKTEETEYRSLPAKRETPERCLYTLLESSRLNQSKGEKWSRGDAFGQIYEAAEEIDLAGKFTLQEYLWVRPWDLVQAARYIRDDWEKWPDDSQARPQGVFVFETEKIEDQTLIYDQESEGGHEVTDSLKIRSPETDGPHLVLMTIAGSDDRPKYMEPRKAFAVPVVESPRYFPIWSEPERNISAYLIDQFEEINRRVESPLILHKRLFSEPTRLGSCCPDLEIWWRGQTIAIRLVENLESYVGEQKGPEKTRDFQRLAEMGRPHVIETEGNFSFQLIKRFTDSINESLESIRKETGGTNRVEL